MKFKTTAIHYGTLLALCAQFLVIGAETNTPFALRPAPAVRQLNNHQRFYSNWVYQIQPVKAALKTNLIQYSRLLEISDRTLRIVSPERTAIEAQIRNAQARIKPLSDRHEALVKQRLAYEAASPAAISFAPPMGKWKEIPVAKEP